MLFDFFNLAGISLPGGKILGVFGQNDPQNVKLEKKTGREGTSSRQTASFEPLFFCVTLTSMSELFLKVTSRSIIDLIKETGFYRKIWIHLFNFVILLLRSTSTILGTNGLNSADVPLSNKQTQIVHEIINYLNPFGLCRCARKKGRKKSHKKCISRMCGATPSGRILTKLGTCVRLMDVIKHATFHRYNLWGLGAVRCWSFHVAIWNQGRP